MFPADRRRRAEHGGALCWAARIVPLVIGLWIAASVMIAYIDALLPHDYEVEMEDPLGGLICLVPLSLAAVAWKWHLVGGIAMVAATAAFFFYFVMRPPYEPYSFYLLYFPPALLYLGSGILNLVAWARERRSRQIA